MISIKSYHKLAEEVFIRINKNIPYNTQLKPYTKKFILEITKYFEDKEEYEKCHILNLFIKSRFDHESNYESKL